MAFQGPPLLRPFRPGERRQNADGSYSTEITTTFQTPDGQWVNAPSLWMGPNGPTQFDETDENGIMQTMQNYEQSAGPSFKRFGSVDEAVASAEAKSKAGGVEAPSGTMEIKLNGRPVQVSDNFRNLSPDEQEATVDEIMANMPAQSAQPAQPAVQQQAAPAAGHNVPEFDPGIEGYNPKTGMVENDGGAVDNAGAFSLAGVDAVPIIGPTLSTGVRGVAAGLVAPFSDKSIGEVYDDMGRRSARVQADNPNAALAGNITGQVAGSMVPMLKAPKLLGVTGSLGSQIALGGASNAAISAADTAVRGGTGEDIGTSAVIGGGLAAAVPVVGSALKGVVNKALTKRLLNNSAKSAMTEKELVDATNSTYKSMRDAGIRYDNNAVDKQLVAAAKEIQSAGYDDSIAKKSIDWLGSIYNRTRGSVDFDMINNRIIRTNEEIGGSEGADREVFKIIRKHLDKLEETAPMTSSTPMPKADFNEMRLTARALAKKNIKQRALKQIMDKADTYASGREAGIRNGIGNLLRSNYGARLFPVGSPERAALLDVQHGRKALRTLSRFGFDIFSKSGNAALMPALGAGAGYAYGGPEYALALGLAGTGAKFMSPRLTEKAMSKAMAAVRSGGLNGPKPTAPRLEQFGRAAGMIARGAGQGVGQ